MALECSWVEAGDEQHNQIYHKNRLEKNYNFEKQHKNTKVQTKSIVGKNGFGCQVQHEVFLKGAVFDVKT